jgi:AcrR family transcriptional regulator
MPRPDLKEQRREQILEAFDACVVRYGYAGVTLEHVAKEAGLARALIRHNVGNREELVAAAIDRYFAKSNERWGRLFQGLPVDARVETLCQRLLDDKSSDDDLVQLTEAVIAQAASDSGVAKRLSNWTDEAIDRIAQTIALDYPDASGPQVEGAAGGILAIYFNLASFRALGSLPKLERASKVAMQLLQSSLED